MIRSPDISKKCHHHFRRACQWMYHCTSTKRSRTADIQNSLNQWCSVQYQQTCLIWLFLTMVRSYQLNNQQDNDIHFSNPDTPSQRILKEHSNDLLRRNGDMKRDHIPRKSWNCQTPIEYFMDFVDKQLEENML